jgi:two-component system phosphate regulon sensor histidine kinase PhoR
MRKLKQNKLIIDSLKAINNLSYKPIVPSLKEGDLNVIINEINSLAQSGASNVSKLKTERARLEFIIDNIGEGLIAVSGEDKVLFINSAARRIFNREELSGKDILYITSDGGFLDNIRAAVDLSTPNIFEYELSGAIYNVNVKTFDEGGVDKSGLTALIFLTDITELKRSDRIREDFFAAASRELKTPLTAINAFAGELLKNPGTKKAGYFADKILQENARMTSLMDDMLALGNIHGKGGPKNVQSIQLSEIADQTVKKLADKILKKNITVSIGGGAAISANREDIQTLFVNLADNAVKYNVQNGKIDIKIKNAPEPSFTVSDSGIGIESGAQSRLFEGFYRVDKIQSKKMGGTGLGLAIIKHICLLYGAKYELKSRPNIGTSIRISFPENMRAADARATENMRPKAQRRQV